MKLLKKTTEDDMIAHFLRTEYNSQRWCAKIDELLIAFNISKSILLLPNITNEEENMIRKKILKYHRGYAYNGEPTPFSRENFIFAGFPSNVNWFWAVLENEDIDKVKYINGDFFNEYSNNTRKPSILCNIILSNPEKNAIFIEYAAHIMIGGGFPELIMVTDSNNLEYIVLEGNIRFTAMSLCDKAKEQKILLGISDEIFRWDISN